ncbi:MAG: rhodanese-like domain-containing protein [Paracoccaceae bacterium]
MFNFLRPSAPATPKPSVADIVKGVADGSIALIDIRELAEVRASGIAKGALHIPMGLLPLKADPKAPDALITPAKPVAVYCASGGRCGMAAQTLKRMGYETVWNIGGLRDWQAAGGQIVKA